MCELFGIPSLTRVGEMGLAPKRYVAVGIMKALRRGSANELARQDEDPSRMPAGVGFSLHNQKSGQTIDVDWDKLIGSNGEVVNDTGLQPSSLEITFSADTSTAPVAPRWEGTLMSALDQCGMGSRYPSTQKWLEHFQNAFDRGRVVRGPFQIAVEEHWRIALAERV
jgi:hypothetical protein